MARREGLYEVDGELVSERTPPVRWRAPCRSRLPRVRASWRWRCLQSLLTAAMFRHGTCEGTRSVPVVQIRRVQTMNPAAVPPGRVTLSGRAAVCPQRISQRQHRYMPPTLLRSIAAQPVRDTRGGRHGRRAGCEKGMGKQITGWLGSNRFAIDSPLEGSGFEPPVPPGSN